MTLDEVKKKTKNVNVVPVTDEMIKTETGISIVKEEYEALVKRGEELASVLQGNDSPLHRLKLDERRALRAYFNDVNDCPRRCHRGYDGPYPEENCIKYRRKRHERQSCVS